MVNLYMYMLVGEFDDGKFEQEVINSGVAILVSTQDEHVFVFPAGIIRIEYDDEDRTWVIRLYGDVYKLLYMIYRYIHNVIDVHVSFNDGD